MSSTIIAHPDRSAHITHVSHGMKRPDKPRRKTRCAHHEQLPGLEVNDSASVFVAFRVDSEVAVAAQEQDQDHHAVFDMVTMWADTRTARWITLDNKVVQFEVDFASVHLMICLK